MATVTRTIMTSPAAQFEYDYDDVLLLISTVRVTNNTGSPLPITVTDRNSSRSATRNFGAGLTTLPLPTGVATRIAFDHIDSNGHLIGIDVHILGG